MCITVLLYATFQVSLQRDSPKQSYGISLTGGSPAQVFTVESGRYITHRAKVSSRWLN